MRAQKKSPAFLSLLTVLTLSPAALANDQGSGMGQVQENAHEMAVR